MSGRFPRTRTGCLSCRQRKKKCDEVKPQCRACTRNKLECTWPPHIVRIFGLSSGSQSHNDTHYERVDVEAICQKERDSHSSPCTSSVQSASIDPTPYSVDAGGHKGDEQNQFLSLSPGLSLAFSPEPAWISLPASRILLSHYLNNTGPRLAPAPDTPFVSWILPVAHSDDLLMNSILALSGGHLLYKLSDNYAVQQATYQHYSLAVQTLSRMVNDATLLSEPIVLLRVALAILLLYHYEVVSGHLDGSPFTHLRACRHLILRLRSNIHQSMSTSEQKLLGFVIEVYSYIVLCNSITPFNMNCNRTIAHDSFLHSLDDFRDSGAFGVMFSGFHRLFELISTVSLFAGEQNRPSSLTDNCETTDRYETYNQLKQQIGELNPSPVMDEPYNIDTRSTHSAALDMFRIALLLFLETTVLPFSKNDIMRVQTLQPYLDLALHHIPQVLPSNYSCIMMWPLVVIGSCLVKEEQRVVIMRLLNDNHYLMRNTGQASDLLRFLWDDPDEYAFGPYGLGLLMRRYSLDYGVI